MYTLEEHHPLSFKLEGQFVGFVGNIHNWKALRLRMQSMQHSEEIQIKLPKELRQSVGIFLHPNQWIRVEGYGKLDPKSNYLKFKATQVTLINEQQPSSLEELPCATLATAIPLATEPCNSLGSTTLTATPCTGTACPEAEPTRVRTGKPQPKLKIRVCQKSGCLKKGGKGLCEALAKVLSEQEIAEYVTIERMGCVKRCSSAPNLVIDKKVYSGVRPQRLSHVTQAIAQRLGKAYAN
jgi:(2Fe-2S) ferredoxin